MFVKFFPYIIGFLIIIAIWEDFGREKRFNDLKRVFTDFWKSGWYVFSLLQRLLDYVFNKLVIRQFLNPWFFFPASILFSIYFFQTTSQETSSIILLVTFFALMWYARETFALRQEQSKNNTLVAGRPLIIIAKEITSRISVTNTGNNIARNINLDIVLNDINSLHVNFIVLTKGQKIIYDISDDLADKIDECNNNLLATLRYFDFQEQNRYQTVFRPNAESVVESGIGRFELISDEKI